MACFASMLALGVACAIAWLAVLSRYAAQLICFSIVGTIVVQIVCIDIHIIHI
jgi:hypothetical protein